VSDEPTPSHAIATRVASVVLELLGWALLLMSVRKLAYGAYAPLVAYDDGVLLTDSMLVSMGEIPHRDFYTNYGPGIFLSIAAIWKLVGVSALAARGFGCLLHLTIAVLSGILAGRMTGRRFSALACGLVAIWLSSLVPSPVAWLAALALALVQVWSLCRAVDEPSPARWMISGALLGATSWYRPDLAACLGVSLLAIGTAALIGNAGGIRQRRREVRSWAAFGLLGVIATVLPVWGALSWLAGMQPISDIFLEQLRIQPARVLPLPTLFALVRVEEFPFPFPAFLAGTHAGSVIFASAGPLLALLMVVAGRRLGVTSRSAPALVGALAIAVLPPMMGRSDPDHCVYAVTPSIVLFAASAHALGSVGTAGSLLASLLAGCLFLPARDLKPRTHRGLQIPTSAFPRYGGIAETDPAVLAVTQFLDARTAPDEPIFVGLDDHRRTILNHLLLYFLVGRRGGTRYMQFDPNLTNREDIQATMIRDLQSRQVNWVVLDSGWARVVEPNESSRPGSQLLDRYLGEHFEPVARFGRFEVRRRVPS
jgi:hypothetical protein